MNYILFDDSSRMDLFPLTLTRPTAELRVGIITIREKWEKYLKVKTSTLTDRYLSVKSPIVKGKTNVLINGSVCPNDELVKKIIELKPNQALVNQDYIIAFCIDEKDLESSDIVETTQSDDAEKFDLEGLNEVECNIPHMKINFPWDIFRYNGEAIREDFKLITKGRKSKALSDTNRLVGDGNIFIEPGAKVECAIINVAEGPVYIGTDAEIMEGAVIRGPFALGEHATLKMSAKIYGATTVGPYSKVGGELNNTVIFGYTNKAHDGFIGNSVIGEWCNLGADSNNSNLKNTYDEVKMWNYTQEKFIPSGLQFCGLIMGDHSKCGINTMFNTGTVIGVNANIFGHGFQRNFIPSYSWGSSILGYTTYELPKAIEVAKSVYERRGFEFTRVDEDIMTNVFNMTFAYRKKVKFLR